MDIPIKASRPEALAMIVQKFKDKSLSVGEKRKLQDQYEEAASGYAKGGVIKGKTMATKKIVEGKETYKSKAAMMKHEKKEPMKKEKAEEKMAKGGVSAYAKGGMSKKKC
jgi:hypothetical protein